MRLFKNKRQAALAAAPGMYAEEDPSKVIFETSTRLLDVAKGRYAGGGCDLSRPHKSAFTPPFSAGFAPPTTIAELNIRSSQFLLQPAGFSFSSGTCCVTPHNGRLGRASPGNGGAAYPVEAVDVIAAKEYRGC
jgi:hypothetical protein